MVNISYYIAESKVGEPLNAPDLTAQLNFGSDQLPNAGVISLIDFTWVRNEYDFLMKYFEDGKTNAGVGITEGPSFRITASNGVITKDVFVGYLDFQTVKIKDRISITCKAVSMATVDWLNSSADFPFEYLASDDFKATGLPGYIDNSYYRFMPYTNNSIPNYEQAAIASITIFAISQSIYKEIEEIAGLISEAGGVFTTIPAAVKIVIKIAYLIVLLIALVKLIEDTIKFIISPVKYHGCMYVRDLLERGATYLNMKIVCDIFAPGSDYYNEVIMPQKLYNAPNKSDISIFGFTTPDKNEQTGYFKGSFKQLIEGLKIKYNAKVVVTLPQGGATPTNQGTITIVRRDLNVKPPQYTLPGIYNPEYTLNMSELVANYEIQFQTDSEDLNTLQNYSGTICQVVCSQKSVTYQPYVRITGIQPENIPFARMSTKRSLTGPENIIRDFLLIFDIIDSVLVEIINSMISVVNDIIGFINKVITALSLVGIKVDWKIPYIPMLKKTELAASIGNRIGMAMLSSDHFTVPKIFILKEGSQSKYNKIHPSNDTLESAKVMWDRFHYVNSMLPKSLNSAYSDRPYGNQYKIQNFDGIPFTWDDFLKVVSNNRVLAPDGTTPAVVESLKFYPPTEQGSSGRADIKARISYIWTLNLQEAFLIPDGR